MKTLPIMKLLQASDMGMAFARNPKQALIDAAELVEASTEVSDKDKQSFRAAVLTGPMNKRYSAFATYYTGMKSNF